LREAGRCGCAERNRSQQVKNGSEHYRTFSAHYRTFSEATSAKSEKGCQLRRFSPSRGAVIFYLFNARLLQYHQTSMGFQPRK
jgi:hypothetical protein